MSEAKKITYSAARSEKEPSITVYRVNGWACGAVVKTPNANCYELLGEGINVAFATRNEAHIRMLEHLKKTYGPDINVRRAR